MINTIGILDLAGLPYDETSITKKGVGGSETWVIYISEALARIPNTRIYIFNDSFNTHLHKDYQNIIYSNMDQFFTGNIKFDALIFSRSISNLHINKLISSGCCNNIYMFAHDTNMLFVDYNDEKPNLYLLNNDIIQQIPFLKDNIKGIFCISDYHKKLFIDNYEFSEDMIKLSGHGISELLKEQNKKAQTCEKDNNIFWPHSLDRGFNILVNKVYPILSKKIPDLKIYVSHYDNLGGIDKKILDLLNKDFVINLGSLSKEKLYEEESKHRCAFYPLPFPETFCISSIEHTMCNCELVMPYRYGPATIFKPYKYFLLDENINFDDKKTIKEVCDLILTRMKEYDSIERINYRKSVQQYLIETYNWDKIAKDLFNDMGLKS